MIGVKTVDLSSRGVTLPSDRVGMVIAQPYLTLTPGEPYRCEPATKERQLEVLTKTLDVSKAAPHGASKTHFTVFPEYSIPGLDGIAIIDTAIIAEDWPPGTIVIGGTDALSKGEFQMLSVSPHTHLDTDRNGLDRIAANEWINCGITWIKAADGIVERWLQPKLSRALPEQNVPCQDMFLGKSVFLFKGKLENGTSFHFSTLVCFDWIATVAGKKSWRWVIEDLHQQAEQVQSELSLTWLFVIQHNPKPSNNEFLLEVASFFDPNVCPNVHRNNACLVFANNAGRPIPGRTAEYGCTSLIFSQHPQFVEPDCRPTFCNGGQHFRSCTLLKHYYDVLFRERGACIHSFVQANPRSLNLGAAGRTLPIDRPFVFPLNGVADPRTPATHVPACVKWLNDELDALPSLSIQYPEASLADLAEPVHHQTIAALRKIPAQSANNAVRLASAESKKQVAAGELNYKHADEWGDTEAKAVEHLIHTLNIIGLGFLNPRVGAEPAHATIVINHQAVDVLAIRGNTHKACIEHSKNFHLLPRRQALLVSMDRENSPWRKKYGSFIEIDKPPLGQERRITDPRGGFLHMGYHKLLDIFIISQTTADLQGAINAELAN